MKSIVISLHACQKNINFYLCENASNFQKCKIWQKIEFVRNFGQIFRIFNSYQKSSNLWMLLNGSIRYRFEPRFQGSRTPGARFFFGKARLKIDSYFEFCESVMMKGRFGHFARNWKKNRPWPNGNFCQISCKTVNSY